MNQQQVYDKVVNHIRQQGIRKDNPFNGGGQYVDTKDPCKRCAKGVLMDITLTQLGIYSPNLSENMDNWAITLGVIQGIKMPFLHALEAIFESTSDLRYTQILNLPTLEEQFKAVATSYNLLYTEPLTQTSRQPILEII